MLPQIKYKMMQSHTNISRSESASTGNGEGLEILPSGDVASFLHPRKSIISDKGSVISTGLFTQQCGGLVIFQPLNLAIVVKPNSWEIVSEMVFYGE